MNNPACTSIRGRLSDYLDGAITGHQMQEITEHIEGPSPGQGCDDCARELAAWRNAQSALTHLGRARPPADLALRLRVAISQQSARRRSRLLDRLALRWENSLQPMLMQISAGVAGSVILVGGVMMLLGAVAAPQAVLADDEPLGAVTAPHYLYSAVLPQAIDTAQNTTVVVEAAIDKLGRVYDFNIVAGPNDEGVRTQIESQLLSSVFQPASAFGVPIRGRAVLTFSGISVRARR
jgi:anti-sigma factor RsiW